MRMKKNESYIDYTAQTLKRVWGRLVGIDFVFLVALLLTLFAFLAPLFATGIMAAVGDINTTDYATIESGGSDAPLQGLTALPSIGTISVVIVMLVVVMIIALFSTAAKARVLTHNTSFGESIKFGIIRGIKLLPVIILANILSFVASIPSMLLLFGGIQSLSDATTTGVILLVVAAILLLLPFIIFLRTIFILFIWAEDQSKAAWTIIKESFALTKKDVSWLLLLFILLYSTIGIPIQKLFDLVGDIGGALLNFALTIGALTPFYFSVLYILYEYAKKHTNATKKKKGA
ncbi:MAG: hypothetical protein OXB96_02450 [Candidatus Kaiserbacteria bacterium]|nr:hypothetical protein [Candidatus Kaiserbacteria bacterium]